MKKPSFLRSGLPLAAVGSLLLITSARADVKSFVVDPTASSLTLSGTALGLTLQPQASGSLTTTYSGNIVADVTDTTIAFVGGSTITANNSGNWQPAAGGVAGSAAANYGGQATSILGTGKAALRNLVFDVTSQVQQMLGGSFAANSLTFTIPATATSVADYTSPAGSGGQLLAGNTGQNVSTAGNVSVVGNDLVLTIAVDYTLVVSDVSGQFRLKGQLVAKTPNVVPLKIPDPVISPGHLGFNIPTEAGKTYTILGSTDLSNFSTVIAQFQGDGTTIPVDVQIQLTGNEFYILRVD